MDRMLAKHIVSTGYRSAGILQELLPLLKAHCQPAEYEQYAKAIAAVGFEIAMEIFNPLYKLYPDLKDDVETSVNRYGQVI